jgi:hypothetical protein
MRDGISLQNALLQDRRERWYPAIDGGHHARTSIHFEGKTHSIHHSRKESSIATHGQLLKYRHYTDVPISFEHFGCELNRKNSKFERYGLWVLKNSFARNSQKQNCARMPYKRLFQFSRHFLSPQFRLFGRRPEFFNSHAC